MIMRAIRLLAGVVVCGFSMACASAPRAPGVVDRPYDLVIENGRIVDGSGNAWVYGDIAVRGDRIVRLAPAGSLARARAAQRLDARGLVVAPGFIDIQSHSRGPLLDGDGRVVSKVTQGITTEIMGEGSTNAPANLGTAGLEAGATTAQREEALRFAGPRGFDAWLRAMEANGGSVNFGSFVGATTVRMYAKGMAEGAATPAELDSMRAVVRNAMQDGAFGVASALIYPPGVYASTEELVEIARAMAPFGGVYITHMRSEADELLEAMDEALRIGREGGVPVEIYHLKAAGRRNWHKAALAVAKIDSARAMGQDVSANMYPYVAGGTGLAACLPPWASADNKLLANIENPETRARMKAEVLQERTEWENLCQLATPEGVRISALRSPQYQQYSGQTVAQIASALGREWPDVVMDLVLAERARIGAMYFIASEENLAMQMRQPWIKFGTDAGGIDPDSARALTHPRAYGTFTRVLGKYVREDRVMPLEEAVRKMSSAVANRLSIQDRGVLREGAFADIVVFDPATVIDRATYDQPHQLSAGMHHVFVNGVQVVRDGRHTGAKPGRIVRGPGWTGTAR
jgi:dihydroorotase/N-acyl-D-amino-acid deacylase